MHSNLPEICFAILPATGEPICIARGESGYQPAAIILDGQDWRKMNEALGITPAHVEAMIVGSMFGWDVPGADPAEYEGKIKAWADLTLVDQGRG